MEYLILSGVLSLYLSFLVCFSFVSHPMGYCLLLLGSSLALALWCFLLSGVGWYLLLFCLVYVGGVYVLFVFIALQDPNPSPYCGGGSLSVIFVFFFFLVVCSCGVLSSLPVLVSEWGYYLCTCYDGGTYLFFCLVLVFGFFVLSLVGSAKESFFR